MDKPEGVSADILNAALAADLECQRDSCRDMECNGFLCLNALRAVILKAKNDAYEQAAMVAVNYGLGGDQFVRHDCDEIAQAIRNLKHEG